MLRRLDLLPVYDSAECDLVGDLIVPLLSNSREYLRGVGFFTSGWLQVCAQGIISLVENGGEARVVLSPILDKTDWEAFQLGERAKTDEVVKRVLQKSIANLATGLEKDTLNCLAWMIADGVFDFRFAVPKDFASYGDYHDKVAVFTDENDDQVAIHGSFNDTLKGSLNGEAFSVFKSWEHGQEAYVQRHHTRLLALWENGNAQFHIVSIPKAARENLIRLRSTSDRPYKLPPERRPPDVLATVQMPACPYALREYQHGAIDAWIKSDCKGVFEMATGTGKTITALAAAADRNGALGHLVLVVAVPYLHLLEQWADECRRFGFLPLLCSSAHTGWHREVKSKLADFRLGVLPNVCILVVHQTAASDTFARMFHCVDPSHTMIVGDEMHRLGSHDLRNALIPQAGLRLGLSATPRRWFDEEGTRALFNYFGPVCFDYPLKDAIGTFLTPYEYLPIPITLSSSEMEYYEELTSKIAILAQGKPTDTDQEDTLRKLLLRRAQILGSAENKIPELLRTISALAKSRSLEQGELLHTLVYCAPGQHASVLTAISNLGLRCHEFVHTVTLKDRIRVLKSFVDGDIQVLVSIKCLDEGVDVPATRTAFLLASTTNPREFIQRRGRILRLADGKSRASIYDFLVVPLDTPDEIDRQINHSLLKREMPRFAEFASLSLNQFQARSTVRPLLNKYGMLHLLDETPWDMYHRLRMEQGVDLSLE